MRDYGYHRNRGARDRQKLLLRPQVVEEPATDVPIEQGQHTDMKHHAIDRQDHDDGDLGNEFGVGEQLGSLVPALDQEANSRYPDRDKRICNELRNHVDEIGDGLLNGASPESETAENDVENRRSTQSNRVRPRRCVIIMKVFKCNMGISQDLRALWGAIPIRFK
jgi:hypothetical protein